ncbi:MAG TPA: hypothetical protein VHN79_04745 [Lacunisphaera sp.]|nr:hypothetical protein [Lacunisphaera sp.]
MNPRFPACFLPLGLLGSVFAAPTETNSTPTPTPTQSYTDRGSTTHQVYGDHSYHGSRFSSPGGVFSHNRSFSPLTVTTYYQMLASPPVPPALGDAIPEKRLQASLTKFSPPSTLASFVYEPFYTPLSPLLFSENLSKARREKLNTYRAARNRALEALRARIDSLQSAAPEVRQAELAAFARAQTPELVDLEGTAEEMRENYVDGSWFESGSDWNSTRRWRLGDNTRWESNVDEIKVMLGAAYFQEGLSPAQRRLLRELAMELTDSLRSPGAEIALSAPGPYFYFTPETARIRLPAGLPPELEQKIQAYQDEKAALKQELRDALYRHDRALFEFKRTNTFKALAEKQAPALARIEQLAEELRAGLSVLPNPAKPPSIPVPRELAGRIKQYMDTKVAWQRAMIARRDVLRSEFPEDRVEFVRQRDSIVIQIVGHRRTPTDTKTLRDAALAELETFNARQSREYTALGREKEKINGELLAVASSLASRGGNKSVELLLTEFGYAFGLQERWERYAEYETAVLQPGLSPEQRRLLFGAALESMELPPGNFF